MNGFQSRTAGPAFTNSKRLAKYRNDFCAHSERCHATAIISPIPTSTQRGSCANPMPASADTRHDDFETTSGFLQSTPGSSNFFKRFTPGVILGVALAAIAVAGILAWAYFTPELEQAGTTGQLDWAFVMLELDVACWFASFALLAAWLGLGPGPLFARLLAVGAISSILIFPFPEGEYFGVAQRRFDAFAENVLAVAFAAAPFGLLHLAGFRLRRDAAAQVGLENDSAVRKEAQFSIRQLLAWTASAAAIATLVRVAHPSQQMWLFVGNDTLVYGSAAVGMACTALMPRRLCASLVGLFLSNVLFFAVWGACLLAVNYILYANIPGFDDFLHSLWPYNLAAIFVAIFVNAVLLLYRRLGYRYTRRTLRANGGDVRQ